MARETWVQSQVESYQRLKKWYLMLPCLTLSIIRSGSRVKWSNPGKEVAPSPTPRCSSYWKRTLRLTLDNGRQQLISCIRVFVSKCGSRCGCVCVCVCIGCPLSRSTHLCLHLPGDWWQLEILSFNCISFSLVLPINLAVIMAAVASLDK